MYVPAQFKEDRIPVLAKAIRDIGFATLVTNTAAGLEANHLPMLFEDGPAPLGTLHGHMARANLQWQNMQPGSEALAIFLGPIAISARLTIRARGTPARWFRHGII